MGSHTPTYFIVGAGLFGVSTALHLKRSKPSAIVTLVDRAPFPCPLAAAHDLNKIIRADYPDPLYMILALEAQESWRNDALYRPYYHETGMIFTENINMGRTSIENYQALGVDYAAETIPLEEGRSRFGGIFRDANWTGAKECFWNPRSGWADAEAAMRATTKAAIKEGVRFVEASISQILLDDTGRCIGATAKDGRTFKADHIILCTGARTAQLLADSAPHNAKLQVNGRMVAAAAVTMAMYVPPEKREKFSRAPVVFNGLDHTHGSYESFTLSGRLLNFLVGECIPLTGDGRVKFTCETSFTNMVFHSGLRQSISVPPDAISQSTWGQDVPQGLKDEVINVMNNVYGEEINGCEVESYRMCWDAVTPNQDWIISAHPHCPKLYIVAGGSFHAWKFLPNIGAYVVQMLDGKLDPEKAARWAWDRGNKGAACQMYIPQRDLKDIRYEMIEIGKMILQLIPSLKQIIYHHP